MPCRNGLPTPQLQLHLRLLPLAVLIALALLSCLAQSPCEAAVTAAPSASAGSGGVSQRLQLRTGSSHTITPCGVALDGSGDVYVADAVFQDNGGLGRVVVLSPSGQQLLRAFPPNTSSGANSSYSFTLAISVALDGAGNIFVADQDPPDNGDYGRVVVLPPNGTLLYIFPTFDGSADTNYSFTLART